MLDVIGRAARSAGEEHGWSSERVALAAREYLRFIRLIERYPTEALVPSVDVDAVWHHHLNTDHYHRDFDGRAPHHDGSPIETRAERFSRTRSLYRIHFGEPGPLWGEAAQCPAGPDPRP
jgi:hypothetical protein